MVDLIKYELPAGAPRGCCGIIALAVGLGIPFSESEQLLTRPNLKHTLGTDAYAMHQVLTERGWHYAPVASLDDAAERFQLPSVIVQQSGHFAVLRYGDIVGTHIDSGRCELAFFPACGMQTDFYGVDAIGYCGADLQLLTWQPEHLEISAKASCTPAAAKRIRRKLAAIGTSVERANIRIHYRNGAAVDAEIIT